MAMHKTVDIGLITSILSWHFLRSHQSSFIHVVTGNGSYANRAGSGTPRHKEGLNINPRQQAHQQSGLRQWSCTKQGQKGSLWNLCPLSLRWPNGWLIPCALFIHPPIQSFIHVRKQNKNGKVEIRVLMPTLPRIRYVQPFIEFYKPDLSSEGWEIYKILPYSFKNTFIHLKIYHHVLFPVLPFSSTISNISAK